MHLDTPATTVKGPEATFTGDVYVTVMHGAEPPARAVPGALKRTRQATP